MIIPQFRCFQDAKFVRIEILLSALSKVADASFDISGSQFTFSCSPYFLRLTFPRPLTEERGEKATYDLESNLLTVLVPKLNEGEEFEGLEFPNQLLATRQQRKKLIAVVSDEKRHNGDENEKSSNSSSSSDDDVDALDTEFDLLQVKENQSTDATTLGDDDDNIASTSSAPNRPPTYGFNCQSCRFFASLDADLTRQLIDLPEPDKTPAQNRKQLRMDDENANFDEGAFLFSMYDEEGEIESGILPFKPWYVVEFEEALRAAGRRMKDGHNVAVPCGDDGGVSLSSSAPTSASTNNANNAIPTTPGDIGANNNNNTNKPSSLRVLPDDVPTNDALLTDGPSSQQQTPATIWSGNAMPLTADVVTSSTAPSSSSATTEQTCSGDDNLIPVEGVERIDTEAEEERRKREQLLPLGGGSTTTTTTTVFAAQQKSTRGGLAYVLPPPMSQLSLADSTTLASIPKKNFLIHSEALCFWQLCDVLVATCYDLVTTNGTGSVESSWTICKLSTCLSWLDSPQSAKELVDNFCRRVLTFPLHRHFGLAQRCLRDLSVLMLSGPRAVVKLLLYTKSVIDSSDSGQHCLSALWINPMLSWVTSSPSSAFHDKLIYAADQIHAYIVRGEESAAAAVTSKSNNKSNSLLLDGSGASRAVAGGVDGLLNITGGAEKPSSPASLSNNKNDVGVTNQKVVGNNKADARPLAWTSLRLPFSEELMTEMDG